MIAVRFSSIRVAATVIAVSFFAPLFAQTCAVDAGPDTTFCQQQGQLFATPASPAFYYFSWSPSTGLDNPYVQNPNVVSNVSNQQYVVTMTDSASCTATDTIIVSAYYISVNDTSYICNNSSVLLDFGSGATFYNWQFFTDTAGNTTSINQNTQTLIANQAGTYTGYATFPNCGSLTSVFVLVDSCAISCMASVTQQLLTTGPCGDSMRFTGSFSGPVGQWSWRVNSQTYLSGYGGTPQLDLLIGAATYNIELFITNSSNQCSDTSSVTVTGTSGFSITAFINSLYACGFPPNSVYMQTNTTPYVPNLTYSWSPVVGLTDPFSNVPNVNDVYNITYTVTVTDPNSGCIATDTVQGVTIATQHPWSNYFYTCNQPSYLSAASPAAPYTYSWSTGDTTNGIYVTQGSVYTCTVQTASCTFTSYYSVYDTCMITPTDVWPGDCNYNLIVDAADVLNIGLASNATGPVRPSASIGFYPQQMTDWGQAYTNCDYKHGDTNGDGIIDVNDTLAITQNYSLTHPFRLGQPVVPATAPTLKLVCTVDTVGLQTLVQVDVVLGTIPTPVDTLYGISFRITSDAGLIDTNQTVINANTSWLGTAGGNMFTFQKHFQSAGVIDFAEVKNNHVNTYNGQGVIATFFIVTTDNLSGIQTCNFELSDVTAVTAEQTYIALNTENDSVVIDPSVPAGIVEVEEPVSLHMYPNPANENVSVQTTGEVQMIEICDITGRTVQTIVPTGNTTAINTASLAEGVYMVRVSNGTTVVTEKLTITR